MPKGRQSVAPKGPGGALYMPKGPSLFWAYIAGPKGLFSYPRGGPLLCLKGPFGHILPYALPEGASAYCTFRCWKGRGNDFILPSGAQRAERLVLAQSMPGGASLSPFGPLGPGGQEKYALSLSPEGPGGGSGTRIPRKAGAPLGAGGTCCCCPSGAILASQSVTPKGGQRESLPQRGNNEGGHILSKRYC